MLTFPHKGQGRSGPDVLTLTLVHPGPRGPINGLKLTNPDDGSDIPIQASVRTRLLALVPFLHHCQNLAGPEAMVSIHVPSLTRTSFERYIDKFDEANPTQYDASEARENYRTWMAIGRDSIPFQDPALYAQGSNNTTANNNNNTAATTAVSTAPIAAPPIRPAITAAAKKKMEFKKTKRNSEGYAKLKDISELYTYRKDLKTHAHADVTAAAPPPATAQPMRPVTSNAGKKKKQDFSHTPINNTNSINVAAANKGKQAEKNYFKPNNVIRGRSRTHRFPPSLTNTSTDVAVSSTNIISPSGIDVVSDLRDDLGESVENVEIASEAIKISMREKRSMGEKYSTSKDDGLEPATMEDAETEPTVYRSTNNKLAEDLISGGVWELLSDSGKALIKELADTDLHSIASLFREQYSSNDDGDATPSVVKGRTDSNSRHQNRVNISEVIADDKDAGEATLSTCDGSDVEIVAHDDPLSDAPSSGYDSTTDLFSADLAPPSVDDEDDLSTISPTIIPLMLTAHKAKMDEVMEDLDIGDVRSHDNAGLILVADGLNAFNIDIECESAAEEDKVDYENRDDEFSDRDDDNATSIRHTTATIRGDAPNSADDTVEIHQYPPFNDGATRFTPVDSCCLRTDGGCNGNVAIVDVRHIDDIMSLLDLDDSGTADDVGVGSVADELGELDIEYERAIKELRMLTEYESTTKEAKVGYALSAEDAPTGLDVSGMLDSKYFVLPRLSYDAKYTQGHVESPHSINYSDVFVFDHLDTSSQADDDPSAAFWPIDIDAPCITHGLAVLTAKLAFEAQSVQFDRGFYDAHRGRILHHSGVRTFLSDFIVTWMDMIPEWKMGRVTIIAINHQRLIFVLILGESDTKLLRLIYMNTIREILWEMGYFHQSTSAHTLLHQPIAHAVVVASPGSYHQDDVGTTQSSRHHLIPAFMVLFECVVWGEIQLVQSYLGRRLTYTRMHGTDVKLCDDDRPDADLHIIYHDVDPCTGHRFIRTSDMQMVVGTCHISVSECNHITSLENWGENDSDVGLDLRLLADASHPRYINVERLHDNRIADLQVGTCNGLLEMRLDAKWNSSQFAVAQLREENGERDHYAPLPKENGKSHHCRNVESDGIPEGEMKEHTTTYRPMSDEDSSVGSGTHFECNGVRQCYDKEYKHTTTTLKLGMTTAYRVQRRVYRMITAKKNGEPSDYSYNAGEKLTYGNHDFESIRFDDKYSLDTDVGCEYDPTRKIHSELVREEVTRITLLCKSFIHHCKRRAQRNQLQANENSSAFIPLPRYLVLMRKIVPRSAFVGQDFEAFGKWLYGMKVASLWGAMHSEDDVCVTFPDITCFDDEVTVIVDTTIDGEREITSTIPVIDMGQSYEREWLNFINETPFDWYSKKQLTVQTATYGAESIAGGATIGQAALTTGAFKYVWVDGKDNISNTLTKHWGYQQAWPLLRSILSWEGDTRDILRGPRKVMKSITRRLRGKLSLVHIRMIGE